MSSTLLQVNYEQSVAEFMQRHGQFMSTEPTAHVPIEVKNLRKRLIKEEFEELMKALEEDDLFEIADGGADLIYVVVGTLLAYGISPNRVFREVHNSNMTKDARTPASLGEKYGSKTPKGINFTPPDIKGLLENPNTKTPLEIRNFELI